MCDQFADSFLAFTIPQWRFLYENAMKFTNQDESAHELEIDKTIQKNARVRLQYLIEEKQGRLAATKWARFKRPGFENKDVKKGPET